jgi:hypothetical protein
VVAKVLFVLIGLFLLGGGFWKLAIGFRVINTAISSSRWPYVDGKITEARVAIHMSTRSRHGGGGPSYEPHIAYAYTVDGRTFCGSTITPGRLWNSRASYASVSAFPAGSAAHIYYAPADPSQSVLVTGLHPFNFGDLAFGVTASSMGLLFVLVGFRGNYVSATSNQLDVSRIPRAALAGLIILFFIGVGALVWLSNN